MEKVKQEKRSKLKEWDFGHPSLDEMYEKPRHRVLPRPLSTLRTR